MQISSYKYFIYVLFLFSFCLSQCDVDFTEIEELCFYNDDLSVLQQFIDNSYASGIDLGCEDNGWYCGSPNPQMDSPTDSWFWNIIDEQEYYFADGDGIVEPLELGLQEWNDGRLTSLMCGAYIYCQLSGPIPDEINQLTEIEQLRLEYNYLSGPIPETLCDLNLNDEDYLEFDLSGNQLCPPYPECINTSDNFWYQDSTDCFDLGDINMDQSVDIVDVIQIVDLILNSEYDFQADMNSDSILNITDIILVVNYILNSTELSNSCYLMPEAGECLAAIPIYYFNTETNSYEMFTWGGCGGVVPFEDLEECKNTCE